jgi:hypothetical protein
MRPRLRTVLAVLCVLAMLLGGGLAWLLTAVRHVPHFYADALAVEPAVQQQSSDEMVRRSATLSNDVRRGGRWQAIFTAQQINGWLAVDLRENYPNAIPPQLRDPRVAIHQGEIILGCIYASPPIRTVLSLTADAYMQSPNVLALRIRRARAGAVPVPLKDVVDKLVHAGEGTGCRVTLRQIDADPLLLLSFPAAENGDHGRIVHVDTIELHEGELYVAGSTERTDSRTARSR